MAIGDAGKEQFAGAIMECRNPHISVGLTPLMAMREELLSNDEFLDPGGIDDVTRDHFLKLLLNCDRWRWALTYNPSDEPLEVLVASTVVKDAVEAGANAFETDNVQQGTLGLQFINFALDGSDPNIPLNSQLTLTPNAAVMLGGIDRAIVIWTRLNSRLRGSHIIKMDSLRILSHYQSMHDYLMTFGGDANRIDVANIRATANPQGADSAPHRLGESATQSTA